MTSSTIKKHLTSDEEIQLPTYKKLPPIMNVSKMQGRKTMSPTAVSVDFSPPSSVQSKSLLSGKAPVKKHSSDSVKSDSSKSPANQNMTFKKSPLIGGKTSQWTNENVATDQSASGIELVGFRMTTDSKNSPEQSSEWTPYGSELPPCKICGDKASGLHYGVNTCEACKAFFRRTLKKLTVDFQCVCTPEQKKLGTDQPRKTACPKCRYERCMKVGMSKDAIKIGRYSITRKRQNDREVKQLKMTDNVPRGARHSLSSKSSSSGSPHSAGQSVSSPEELSSDITSLSLQENRASSRATKRPLEDESEDGLLYRSLTKSIFLSLIENQHVASLPKPVDQTHDELSPMEKLLTASGNANAQMPANNATNSSTNSSSPNFQNISLNMPLSPIEQVISNNGKVISNPNEELSAVESLFSAKNQWSPGYHGNSAPLTNGQQSQAEPSVVEQLLMKPSINEESHFQLSDENTQDLDGLTSPDFPEFISGGEMDIPSPMERLIMSDFHVDLNSPNTMLETHEEMPHHMTNGFDVVQPKSIPEIKQLHTSVVDCSKVSNTDCLEQQADFVDIMTSGENFVEDPDEIEVQSIQLARFENPVLIIGKDISLGEIVDIVAELRKAAVVLFDKSNNITCEEIKKRHAEYLEQYTLRMKVFGDMSNISKEEYLEFYNQTGIDIDNRQQILIEALKYLEESIAKLVKFAKAIPGFSNLAIEDQVSLVKVSRFEHDMIKLERNAGCIINPRMMVTTTPWDKDYHINEIGKVLPIEFVQAKMKAVQQLTSLGLTYEESVILKAIVITFPDRCSLDEPEKVEILHNRLIACFMFMLNQRNAITAIPVKVIMKTLFRLRELAVWDTQIVQEMFEVWPVSSNHQLVKEFVS